MAVLTVSKDSFESVTSLPGVVLLDFWATWCPPCRTFKPIFEKAAEKNPDITFGSIDTEKESLLSSRLGISSIPTLMGFRDGILVFAQPGALSAAAFDSLIDAIRALDTDEVRAKLAEQDRQD